MRFALNYLKWLGFEKETRNERRRRYCADIRPARWTLDSNGASSPSIHLIYSYQSISPVNNCLLEQILLLNGILYFGVEVQQGTAQL